ncbi:MAG: hypothetical protein P8163_02400 [Candidatus Thiodiazotropha sp.]
MNTKSKTAWVACACLLMLSCTPLIGNGLSPDPVQTNQAGKTSPYFPLSVGNRWRYSCFVEGEYTFDKTLTITAREKRQGRAYYRGELQVGDDPSSLELYYHVDELGGVHMSVDPMLTDDTLLVTMNPLPGDRIGNLRVASEQDVETPGTDGIKALLIENFSLDDPQLHEERRMEWEGRYYARGIGLVIEADGLGGSCSLKEFHQGTP